MREDGKEEVKSMGALVGLLNENFGACGKFSGLLEVKIMFIIIMRHSVIVGSIRVFGGKLGRAVEERAEQIFSSAQNNGLVEIIAFFISSTKLMMCGRDHVVSKTFNVCQIISGDMW